MVEVRYKVKSVMMRLVLLGKGVNGMAGDKGKNPLAGHTEEGWYSAPGGTSSPRDDLALSCINTAGN